MEKNLFKRRKLNTYYETENSSDIQSISGGSRHIIIDDEDEEEYKEELSNDYDSDWEYEDDEDGPNENLWDEAEKRCDREHNRTKRGFHLRRLWNGDKVIDNYCRDENSLKGDQKKINILKKMRHSSNFTGYKYVYRQNDNYIVKTEDGFVKFTDKIKAVLYAYQINF